MILSVMIIIGIVAIAVLIALIAGLCIGLFNRKK